MVNPAGTKTSRVTSLPETTIASASSTFDDTPVAVTYPSSCSNATTYSVYAPFGRFQNAYAPPARSDDDAHPPSPQRLIEPCTSSPSSPVRWPVMLGVTGTDRFKPVTSPPLMSMSTALDWSMLRIVVPS